MKKLTLFLALFFCLSLIQAQTNILANYNGDFEDGFTNWRFYEVPNSIGSTAEITSTAVSGTKAVKLTCVANNDGKVTNRAFDNWGHCAPVTGRRVYNLKAFLKSDSPSGLTCEMLIGFFDASGAFLGQKASILPLTDTYTEFSIQNVAPANAASCLIAFRLTDAVGTKLGGTMYIDNVRVIEDPMVYSADLLSGINGGFELGNTSNWTYLSYINGVITNLTALMSTTDVHDGTYAAQVDWLPGSTPNIVDQRFDQNPHTVPGQKLTYKAWAKLVSGSPFILGIHCTFFNAAGGVILDVSDNSWILSAAYTEHTWVLPEVPAGTVTTNIGFRAFGWDGTKSSRFPATAVSCLIDNVRLLDETPPVPTDIISLNTVKYSLYPNPASEIINITSSNALKSASIYNVSGQKVKDINTSFTNINISNLHSGIYYVKLKTEGGEATQKFVVK
jgi:hypothetical protein